MREIKFRSFNDDSREFEYFDLDTYDSNYHDTYGNLEQYTGLKDKNGKEIYEEDVLECVSAEGIITRLPVHMDKGSYKFYDKGCQLETLYNILLTHKVEIIGNIHENGDLLEGEA